VLLAVPNASEGTDPAVIAAIGTAFGPGVIDVHADPDHGRSVYTLHGEPGDLAGALVSGARECVERIDLRTHIGIHPHVGALDVAPVVFLDDASRGAACAEALVVADRIARELALPVFLYGALSGGRTRAELRRGGPAELARRMRAGELAPDFGPRQAHPTAGAVLVAARPPLVAFNVELGRRHTLDDARRIAALLREGGAEGLPGVRAIGLALSARGEGLPGLGEGPARGEGLPGLGEGPARGEGLPGSGEGPARGEGLPGLGEAGAPLPARSGVAQVSFNVEDPAATPLRAVVEAVARHADVAEAELVGLAPAAAFAGFPGGVPVRNRRTIEDALGF
jgi:glutamate formiminotransferase/glutamate formiminotransferase/formiminotetrahydrofolate cyclodeaminase